LRPARDRLAGRTAGRGEWTPTRSHDPLVWGLSSARSGRTDPRMGRWDGGTVGHHGGGPWAGATPRRPSVPPSHQRCRAPHRRAAVGEAASLCRSVWVPTTRRTGPPPNGECIRASAGRPSQPDVPWSAASRRPGLLGGTRQVWRLPDGSRPADTGLAGYGKAHHRRALRVDSSPGWKRIPPVSAPVSSSMAVPAPEAGSIPS
jgi:hypothetical protein